MQKILFKRFIPKDWNNLIQKVGTGVFESEFTHQGEFLYWATDFEELRDGVGTFTTALVKLPDGTVEKVLPENLKFIDDKEKNNLSAIENVKRDLAINGKLTKEMLDFLDLLKNKLQTIK